MLELRTALLAVAAAFAVAACGPSTNPGTCEQCGDEACVDLTGDPQHCGACGNACGANEACSEGMCRPAQAQCSPGETESCYDGAAGTAGVGPCVAGTRTCLDNGQWGACAGQVVPSPEVCGNGVDENCSGAADEDIDEDGDGFTTCGGDCCDSTDSGCQSPELVNPGAFEAADNQLDDDCDGTVDNAVAATCDTGLPSNSSDPLQYAAAMDLCQTATEAPDDRRWGVISGRFARVDGTNSPEPEQRAIRPDFGATAVQLGGSMVVLSTAHAAATAHTNPSFSTFASTNHGTTSGFPADWYAANGSSLPNSPGCPAPSGNARDPVMLELRVRTPTNARSFRMRTNFMSAEYPEWTCSAYNDFFVVLLDSTWSGTPANPADKNLAVYTSPAMQVYPVGVNLAFGNTGLFTQCENGATGCAFSATPGTINTCVGTAELVGTGMDGAGFACGDNDRMGGGTGWLTTSGNVNGGEIITLRIALWDTSDGNLDSIALIDGFEWSVEASEPGTVIDVD